MTHVFIVDDNTFKYHLEYMFAGTGANKDALFLQDVSYLNPRRNEEGLTSTSENNLVSMIADVSKIRVGDKVIFYLQANKNHEGLFFGVFKIKSVPFYDSSDDNYLYDSLRKKLNFRVCIEPDIVYPLGITEHEYLDDLTGKTHPSQLCWSMIYRKLKGNRGCTMITNYEYEDLLHKLKFKNNNITINSNGYTYDKEECKISDLPNENEYKGDRNSLSIKERLLYKAERNNAFEVHLQAYILQNFDQEIIRDIIFGDDNIYWIGNEVSCGVGMQRIDILTIQKNDSETTIRIIELKDEPAYIEILKFQLPWYKKWVESYIVPNIEGVVNIIPTIISKRPGRNTSRYNRFIEELNRLNSVSVDQIDTNIELFEYVIDEQTQEIKFNKR